MNPTIDKDGNKFWYQNGQLHRDNGPAIDEWTGGSKEWYQNGKWHRTDGPAVELAHGSKAYYINGQQLTYEEWAIQRFVLHKQKHELNNR